MTANPQKVVTIKAECDSCHGSGVFKGYSEGHKDNGLGTMCSSCRGRGWKEYNFWEFEHRKIRHDIGHVRMPNGEIVEYGRFIAMVPEVEDA